MNILGLHHAQITIATADEAAARAFYVDFLGLTEIQKPDSLRGRGGFWLRAGDSVVHVGVEEGVDRAATKAHLAYRVDDLSAWRDRLHERGIATQGGIPIPGHERFEFRDPFGNRVEMIQELEKR